MQTHCLLRIESARALSAETPVPEWVTRRLTQVPWVVVRRAQQRDGLVPVGVRGGTRAERFAGWLRPTSVVFAVTPLQLAARHECWTRAPGAALAALAALVGVEPIMAGAGFTTHWGPAGSVAFELASGCPTVTAASDLDLVLHLDAPLRSEAARALLGELAQLPARADVLVETAAGGVALAEYARARPPYLVRTVDGPCLLEDPWARVAGVAA